MMGYCGWTRVDYLVALQMAKDGVWGSSRTSLCGDLVGVATPMDCEDSHSKSQDDFAKTHPPIF